MAVAAAAAGGGAAAAGGGTGLVVRGMSVWGAFKQAVQNETIWNDYKNLFDEGVNPSAVTLASRVVSNFEQQLPKRAQAMPC